MLLLAADVDSVSAQVGPTGTIVEFDYTLANVSPTGFSPRVVVSTGVIDTRVAASSCQSGALKRAQFLTNAWTLTPTGTETLNATITDWRLVTGPTVTGTAYVPGGASLTVSVEGGAPIRLPNGKFSIPTGLDTLGAEPPKGVADGGSEYVVVLNAARSSPRGSHLILTFA